MEDFEALSNQKSQEDMGSQLHDLVTNETLITMFPNLNILASIHMYALQFQSELLPLSEVSPR